MDDDVLRAKHFVFLFALFSILLVNNFFKTHLDSEVFADLPSNWGQFHGDSAHSGYSSFSGPINPKIIWTYALGGTNIGLVAYNDMLIVSCVSKGQLLALSEENGSSLINFKFVTPGWYSPQYVVSTYLAIGVGLIFFSVVGSDWYQWSGVTGIGPPFIDGNYLSNGQNVWACEIPRGSNEYYRQNGEWHGSINPYYGLTLIAYYQGDVYAIPFDGGNITAIQSSSGIIDWQLNLSSKIDTIPTIGSDVLVIGYSNENQVTGISAKTGILLWNFTTDGPVCASPAYYNGYFFFGTKSGNFYCIDKDGYEKWRMSIGARIETTPAIAFGKVFFGGYNGTLYAVDVDTGEEVWKTPVEGGLLSPPVVASNGVLYEATTSGMLYALNVTDGRELWTYTLDAGVTASPVLDNGYLFVVDSNGKIYAFANGYSVTFHETGLPSETVWNVTLGKEISISNTNTNTFLMANGVYPFNVSKLYGYAPTPSSGYVTVNGADVNVSIVFVPTWKLPSAPKNLKATGSVGSIVLHWEPPEDSGTPPDFNGSGIEAYCIYRSTTSDSEQYYDMVGGTTFVYTDSSVNPNTLYFYKVTAVNPVGQSGFSNEAGAIAIFYTVPSPPLNLTAVTQGSSIYIEWEPPASNGGTGITGYILYRGASPDSIVLYVTLPGNVTYYEDTNFAPSQVYYYKLTATNNVGQSNPSNLAIATAPQNPPPFDWIDFFVKIFWLLIGAVITAIVNLSVRKLRKRRKTFSLSKEQAREKLRKVNYKL
jgi:outer membrane protein assembly factor BamB